MKNIFILLFLLITLPINAQAAQDTVNDLATQGNEAYGRQNYEKANDLYGKALELDVDNRRLVEESENLRSNMDMLESENRRLNDKMGNEDFMNGALAVLLGVIITLVVPRLWPKRRKSSSWA